MNEQARELFAAGATAMGLLGGGRPNPGQAVRYFSAASEADPTMCDAWLGRMLCGDTDTRIVYKAWSARETMHAEIGRLGISPALLMPKVDIGMGVVALDQQIYDRGVLTVALARMLAMRTPPDYQQALETLRQAPAGGLSRWVSAAMYYRAARWPEVIDTLAGRLEEFGDDRLLAVAARTALGIAYAHMGDFDPAERYLREVEAGGGELPSARQTALWFLALIARERGDEDLAVAMLRRVNAEAPAPEVAAAIADAGIRLRTTSVEAIAARADVWDPASGPDVAELAGAAAEAKRADLLTEAMAELNTQIGMAGLKEQIRVFRARMRMAEKRREVGLKTVKSGDHMVFVGPPGTGKTTVAEIIAKVLCGLGIVDSEHVEVVSGRDLIGKFEGHSEDALREVLDRAAGGILFFDEIYAIVQERSSGVDPFGQAIVDQLNTFLENSRDRTLVIIAGYDKDVKRFLAANQGLPSRFKHRFVFETYSPEELVEIAGVIAKGRDDILDQSAADYLLTEFSKLAAATMGGLPALDFYGNGRFVRMAVERAADYRDLRLDDDPDAAVEPDDLMTIRESDMSACFSKVLAEIESEARTATTGG
jgi:type VII secretion ATPase EccA